MNGVAELRSRLQSVDPKVPVFSVKPMDERLSDALASPRFHVTAVSLFGVFALVLAILGVYGVVSCAMSIWSATRRLGKIELSDVLRAE